MSAPGSASLRAADRDPRQAQTGVFRMCSMTSRGEPNEPPPPLAVFRRCSITFEGAGLSMSENACKSIKADARTRTGDPFITSEVLYQLSYVGGRGQFNG